MSAPAIVATVAIVVALLVVAASISAHGRRLGRLDLPAEALHELGAELRAMSHELRVTRGTKPRARDRAATRAAGAVPAPSEPRTESIPSAQLAQAVENAESAHAADEAGQRPSTVRASS